VLEKSLILISSKPTHYTIIRVHLNVEKDFGRLLMSCYDCCRVPNLRHLLMWSNMSIFGI